MEKEIDALITQLYGITMRSEADPGHKCLLSNIIVLLKQTNEYQYHDFKNSHFATPKMALLAAFDVLRERVQTGEYDN